jgi:hypothetical protein
MIFTLFQKREGCPMHDRELMKKLYRQTRLNECTENLAQTVIPFEEFLGRNFLHTISIAPIDFTDGRLLSKVGGGHLEICDTFRMLVVRKYSRQGMTINDVKCAAGLEKVRGDRSPSVDIRQPAENSIRGKDNRKLARELIGKIVDI